MVTRIVSFLGLGPQKADPPYYTPTRYTFDGVETPETPLAVAAPLARFVGTGPVSLITLATQEARERWFGAPSRFLQYLDDAKLRPASCGYRSLPSGRDEAELWAIFRAVYAVLVPRPIALDPEHVLGPDDAFEAGPPETIVLDVTHGFRSQPFFAASAVAFARAEARRERAKTAPAIRIVYGAFEQSTKTPVWELTPLIEVLEWNAAIDALRRHGRGDDLEGLLRSLQARAIKNSPRGERPPHFGRLGIAVKSFADALVTARVPDLVTKEASNLAKAVALARPALVERIPLLESQLQELERWCTAIQAEKVVSPAGVVACLSLGDIYRDLERYSELSALLRETAVTSRQLAIAGTSDPEQPRHENNEFDEQRGRADREFGARAHAAKGSKSDLDTFAAGLSKLRNDVQHAAFNSQSRTGGRIRGDLAAKLAEAKEYLLTVEPALPLVPQLRPGLTNCTNHPIASWTEPQRSAAALLNLGEPMDLEPFLPLVEPGASSEDVEKLAEQLAARVDTLGAVVMGELTLSLALVARLQAKGVRCFAATTGRRSDSRPVSDTVLERVSQFEFVRWREYSRLGR